MDRNTLVQQRQQGRTRPPAGHSKLVPIITNSGFGVLFGMMGSGHAGDVPFGPTRPETTARQCGGMAKMMVREHEVEQDGAGDQQVTR